MNLPKFALDHKAVVLVATGLLVAVGVLVFMTAPRKEDPTFIIRDGFIVTPWLGATASALGDLVVMLYVFFLSQVILRDRLLDLHDLRESDPDDVARYQLLLQEGRWGFRTVVRDGTGSIVFGHFG